MYAYESEVGRVNPEELAYKIAESWFLERTLDGDVHEVDRASFHRDTFRQIILRTLNEAITRTRQDTIDKVEEILYIESKKIGWESILSFCSHVHDELESLKLSPAGKERNDAKDTKGKGNATGGELLPYTPPETGDDKAKIKSLEAKG